MAFALAITAGTVRAADLGFVAGEQRLASNTLMTGVALADVDGDADLDLVIAIDEGPSQLWINQGGAQGGRPGAFVISPRNLGRGASRAVAAGDLDLDGDLDLLFLDDGDEGRLSVWINQGGGQTGTPGVFQETSQTNRAQFATAVALGPLNAMPGPDAFIAAFLQGPAGVWMNDGAGRFHDSGQALQGGFGTAVALGDIDGDRDLDAVVAAGGFNRLWMNQGGAQGGLPGIFAASGEDLGAGTFFGVVLGDVDGDGDLDVLLTGTGPERLWLNQGGRQGGTTGTFRAGAQNIGIGTGTGSGIALGDFDRDGDLDAVVARTGGCRFDRNDGNGDFVDAGVSLPGGNAIGAVRVAVGDLDSDGYLDVVAATPGDSTRIWFNRTGPTLATRPEFVIRRFAGTGGAGEAGDGGPATLAQVNDPVRVAADGHGNVYLAENFNAVVRRVDRNGIISTFAGTGASGFAGDGGPATSALFTAVDSVSADGEGNVWIADHLSHRIRRVDSAGIITTAAGTGEEGFAGDGGPAVLARLAAPEVTALDRSGNLYFFDALNYRLRRVDTNGIITTIAGNGTPGDGGDNVPALEASIGGVLAIAVDPSGNVFFSGSSDPRIRRLGADGMVRAVVGLPDGGFSGDGGPAASARLSGPAGIAFDEAGALFIADASNARIRRVGPDGLIATVAGTGMGGTAGDGGRAAEASLGSMLGLATDPGGTVLIAGANSRIVRQLTPAGAAEILLGHYASEPAPGALLQFGVEPTNSISHPELRVHVGNSGNADLLVTAIEIVPSTADFTYRVERLDSIALGAPHVIPGGNNPAHFTITVKATGSSPTSYRGTLRVHTSDPVRPVIDYPLAYAINASVSATLESALLSLFLNPNRSAQLASAPPATSPAPADLGTATFAVDTNATRSLSSEIPGYLGGGTVVISNFTGSVTVRATALPNEDEHRFLTVVAGRFAAPSFPLPSGLVTGPNTLTFVPSGMSSGWLVRSNGNYALSAAALIVNDLFPGGLPVQGSYSGVFDTATGRASARSNSEDLVPRPEALRWLGTAPDLRLTWPDGNTLQEAPSVLGPWRSLPDATRPRPVDPTQQTEQYFRFLPPAARAD